MGLLDKTYYHSAAWSSVGSLGEVTVDFRNDQAKLSIAPEYVFAFVIKNDGLTTIKDCSGQVVGVTRRVAGQKPARFDTDRYDLGWANSSKSDKRNIMRSQSFHMDVATLVLLPGSRSRLIFGGLGRPMPNTLREFLNRLKIKQHTHMICSSALTTHARERFQSKSCLILIKPISIADLLNTRFPCWRLLWWLRSQWSRRKR